MNFLILGGTGYLGSKVIRALLDLGHSIVCTKRLESNLDRLKGVEEQIKLIGATIDELEAIFVNEAFDWVLNMVCNYGRCTILYDNVLESNIVFPLSVLNLAVKHGVKNYMTIGTGLPSDLNMYSFSKNQFANFGRFYVEKHGINFINVKLEMFYGADEPKERFLPSCIIKMLKNQDIDLTQGTQKRDIISIHDVVEAILWIINAMLKGFHEISVGTGTGMSIQDILNYIKLKTNSRSNLKFGAVPMRKGEPDCVADTTALDNIGYKCKYDWQSGLSEMIEEIRINETFD